MVETIWSNGTQLHMKSEKELGYILVKPSQRQLYTVNLMDKQLIDLSEKVAQAPDLPDIEKIEIEYFHHGSGPIILNYPTELYLLKVNGEVCLTEYLTTAEPELTAIVPSFELITEYKINSTFKSLPKDLDICFVANNITYKRYKSHGFPLKSNDQFGKTQFEVTSIDKNAENPINNFKFPENYIVLTYDQMMDAASNIVSDPSVEMHPEPITPESFLD